MKRSLLLILTCSTFFVACSKTPSTAELGSAKPVEDSVSTPAPVKKTYNGPFGLAMGLRPDELRQLIPDLAKDSDGAYIATSVPVAHDALESYVLVTSEKSGLCAISAIGKNINSGQTGAEVRSVHEALAQGLTEKYGPGKKYDFASGLMEDTQYWMIALSDKNRTLATVWSKEEGSNLPKELSSILVQAHASDMSTGYVNLRYEFANIGDCELEEKAKSNKAL